MGLASPMNAVATSIHGDSYFGGYATSDKRTYVFILRTSDGDFETHGYGYLRWFEAISLHD